MRYMKRTLILALVVVMLTSVLVIPAAALEPTWNQYFYDNFPEQRVGYYHYGYTYALQRFLYVYDTTTQSDIISSGGIDGMYGTGTKNAVVTFQEQFASNNPGVSIVIPASEEGKVGQNTWKAIAYMMYEVYLTGYQDWYSGMKKVMKLVNNSYIQYFIDDYNVGGTFHYI